MFQSHQRLQFKPCEVSSSSVTMPTNPLPLLITGCTNSKQIKLPNHFQPRQIDVLCGRGRGVWDHVGNRRFKTMISEIAPKYATARTKMDKGAIVASMVDKLREQGVLFVKKDNKTQSWYDIGEYQAREKTSHAIRDHIYKINATAHTTQHKSKRRTPTSLQLQHDNVKGSQQSTPVRGTTTQHESTQTYPIPSSTLNLSFPHPSPATAAVTPRRVSVESMSIPVLGEGQLFDFGTMNEDEEHPKKLTEHTPEVELTTPTSWSNTMLLDAAASFLERAQESTAAEADLQNQFKQKSIQPVIIEDEENLPWSDLFPVEAFHQL